MKLTLFFSLVDDVDLYIVIHSIDGLALRSVKTQAILSALAAIPSIHFICSMDHINAPLCNKTLFNFFIKYLEYITSFAL